MLLWLLIIGGVGAALPCFHGACAVRQQRRALKRRMELIKERHGDVIAGNAQAQIRKLFAERASKLEGYASTLIPKPALLRKRLEMTGKDISLGKYAMVCIGVTTLIALMLDDARRAVHPARLCSGMLFGIGGPHFVIGKMIKRRVTKFNYELPRCDRADGARPALGPSDHRDARHRRQRNPRPGRNRVPNGVADKMKIGRTMEAALQETADRLGTAEFQFFVITLAIQRETGGNLAETLSNLADVLRKRAQMKLKIRAMSSESKASAYIVGSLPFIVFTLVWMINPHYMRRLLHRSAADGRRHRRHGAGWASAPFIMAKMVNFEI